MIGKVMQSQGQYISFLYIIKRKIEDLIKYLQ